MKVHKFRPFFDPYKDECKDCGLTAEGGAHFMNERERRKRLNPGTLFCANCEHAAELHHDYKWSGQQGCTACSCSADRSDIMLIPEGCVTCRVLDDGRLATLYDTMFGSRILIGPADDLTGGNEEWMFEHKADVTWADWDGYGQPPGWKRHKLGSEERYNPELCGHPSTHATGEGDSVHWICNSCGAVDPHKGDLM